MRLSPMAHSLTYLSQVNGASCYLAQSTGGWMAQGEGMNGDPGAIRTRDPQIRNLLLQALKYVAKRMGLIRPQ